MTRHAPRHTRTTAHEQRHTQHDTRVAYLGDIEYRHAGEDGHVQGQQLFADLGGR
jgi:hypothetical protein